METIDIAFSLSKLAEEIDGCKVKGIIPSHIKIIIEFAESKITDKDDIKTLKTIGKRMSKYIGHWEKFNLEYYILYLALKKLLERNGLIEIN